MDNGVTGSTETAFKPKYPAPVHLNIVTERMKGLKDVIKEEFDNETVLYYYIDISTALQINDHQMTQFTVLMDGKKCRLSILNYDLHTKGTNECLYGVIVLNNNYNVYQDKWRWKLDEYLTADHILNKYKIKYDELPRSSRKMSGFQKQLSQTLVFKESLIDNADWFKLQRINFLNPNNKFPKVAVALNKEIWIKECKESFQNIDLPLIPVLINKDNNHWIEWIKIINIKSQNLFVGISCKYDKYNNEWKVESLCLDREYISNNHRMIGLNDNKYIEELKNLKPWITEITFINNEIADIYESIYSLEQQLKSQLHSIEEIEASLLRVKNVNNGAEYHPIAENKISEEEQPSIDQTVDVMLDFKITISPLELPSDWECDDDDHDYGDYDDDDLSEGDVAVTTSMDLQSDWKCHDDDNNQKKEVI